MKLLVVRSNPRKGGRTQHFTNLFVQGARSAGAEVRDVDLMDRTVGPCRGCYHCWVVTPGQCVLRDDMDELLRWFIESDAVVCASPLYYYALSSRMHTFLERTLPLTDGGMDTTPRGLERNRIRYPEAWQGKTLIFLIVGAMRAAENFQPVRATCRLIAEGLGMTLGGVLVRPESYLTAFTRAKPKGIRMIEAAFVNAGMEAARTGRLSEDVCAMAALPLASNDAFFRSYSGVYWANALGMGAAALDTAALVQSVSNDVRILMPYMVSAVDPLATAQVQAVLQFDLADTDEHYCVRIDRGKASLTMAEDAAPDLRVTCPAHVWVGILVGDLDPREAMRRKMLALSGDRSLFARLARFFPIVG